MRQPEDRTIPVAICMGDYVWTGAIWTFQLSNVVSLWREEADERWIHDGYKRIALSLDDKTVDQVIGSMTDGEFRRQRGLRR